MRVTVLGAGSWGTTLADLLARNGNEIALWAREPEVVQSINEQRENELFLPGAHLAESLVAHGTIADAVGATELMVSAAPSHAVRVVTQEAGEALGGTERPIVVTVSKGLEPGTHHTMSEILEETVPGCPVVALSGPSFAREVFDAQPTAVVAASTDPTAAEAAQRVFSSGYFRVYTSSDILGVELGGALKNVIALAAGILEGLGLGHNPRAALITRGLAEITRLGVASGADPMTFAGLAGMGDLVLTATGALSRNRALGVALGRGESLDDAMRGRRTVVEGVRTARTAVELAARCGVELPIAREVTHILFDGKSPQQAIEDLMVRELKAEQWQ